MNKTRYYFTKKAYKKWHAGIISCAYITVDEHDNVQLYRTNGTECGCTWNKYIVMIHAADGLLSIDKDQDYLAKKDEVIYTTEDFYA